MEWYNKYYLSNLDLKSNYSDDFYKIILSKLKNKQCNKNIEYKIDSIENEYLDKLKKLEYLCINKKEINQIEKNNSLVIIQKELEIIKLLSKYTLQNTNLNYNFFMNSLKLLLHFSEILKKRLGQNDFILEKSKFSDSVITRCSYKFCSYQHNCNYNYNKYTKNKCYQDHYVHNMISLDLKTIINYINSLYNNDEKNLDKNKNKDDKNNKNNENKDNKDEINNKDDENIDIDNIDKVNKDKENQDNKDNKVNKDNKDNKEQEKETNKKYDNYDIEVNNDTKLILHNKEILKTINTLNYVISHMENELRNKCLYQASDKLEQFHYINNN